MATASSTQIIINPSRMHGHFDWYYIAKLRVKDLTSFRTKYLLLQKSNLTTNNFCLPVSIVDWSTVHQKNQKDITNIE